MTGFAGVVLTGGASRRMGQDKAFVEVGGRPMASIAAAALREAGAVRVVAVGGDVGRLEALGFDDVVGDQYPGEGPLGGILTALDAADHDVVVVLACDLPYVDAAAIDRLCGALTADHDVAVARRDRVEPLLGAWRRQPCRIALAASFAGGERAVHRAVSGLRVVEVEFGDDRVLHNANRPDDLPR